MMADGRAASLPFQCGMCKARFFKVELLEMHLKNFHSSSKSTPSSIVQRIRSLYVPEQAPQQLQQSQEETEHDNSGDEQMYMVVNSNGTMYMIQNEPGTSNTALTSNIILDEDSQGSQSLNVQFENSNGELQIANGIHIDSGEIQSNEDQICEDNQNDGSEVGADGEVVHDGVIINEHGEIVTEDGETHTEGEIETTTEVITDDQTVVYHQGEYENGEIQTYGEVQTDDDVEYAVEYVQYEDSSETAEDGMDASDTEQLTEHGVSKYPHAPVFPCKKCCLVFSTRHDRRLHLQTHVRDLRFFCNVCGRGFHRYPLLKLHSNVHVAGKQHQCPHCNKFYRSQVYLKKHIAMHTSEAPPRFECGVCGARAALRADLRRHMETHAPPDPRARAPPPRPPNRCSICQIPIQRGLGYSRRCAECDAKFHGEARPKRTEELGRPYQCSERGCLKSFRHPGHLRRHLATHVDDYD